MSEQSETTKTKLDDAVAGQNNVPVMCRWEDVNFIIKWTLENAKHLEPDDIYLIEKETDSCHLALLKKGN